MFEYINNLDIVMLTGLILTIGSLSAIFCFNIYPKIKLKRSIRKISIGEDRPYVEHIKKCDYGYRIFVKLPKKMTNEQFIDREEILQDYINYQIYIKPHRDFITVDVVKKKEKYKERAS